MLEEEAAAKHAIESARTWDLKSYNPAMFYDLEQCLLIPLAFSCAKSKWDGPQRRPNEQFPARSSQLEPVRARSVWAPVWLPRVPS
jgi:hypothetical protein